MRTTAAQAVHLFRIAAEAGISAEALAPGLALAVTASIKSHVRPDLEPFHPRMGILIQETAAQAAAILAAKSVRR